MLERLSDLAHRRRRRIVIGAVMLAIVAAAVGGSVASRLASYGADDPATDSVKTSNAIERATGVEAEPGVVVLVDGAGKVTSPETRARVDAVARTIARDRDIGKVAT